LIFEKYLKIAGFSKDLQLPERENGRFNVSGWFKTLKYYRSIFVTLILTSGVPDPVFKNKKIYFL